ncbi:MAG: (Fe-S)-binding protein [Gammaproteobacteria bacterium]|nr:(Fe-S)-binding protein [Gammaproteobacteria bacterium]MCB1851800.1 (Fe-S)-binding protein [Gammaproteobacteria bacterium]
MNRQQILAEADRCVKCGLCLPHCPTYRITRDEGDSPRGRIALMQAWIGAAVESPRVHWHLDRCLGCQACESACPSGVKYGQMIDSVRAQQPHWLSLWRRWCLMLLSRLPYYRSSRMLLRIYHNIGLRSLLQRAGGDWLRRLNQLLPNLEESPSLHSHYPAVPPLNGSVALFTGCVGRIADLPALLASIRLLTLLGFAVEVPEQQTCCGALHQHNGWPDTARQLAATNRRIFDALEVDAILYTASGCGIQLLEYAKYGQSLSTPVMDICSFLADSGQLDRLHLAPLKQKVLLHHPCSSRRIADGGNSVVRLLRRIPDIQLRSLPREGCCGAAGNYLLLQPAMADRLRQTIIEQIEPEMPEILATTNTGCALHLTAGLSLTHPAIRVIHPVQLLSQQLNGNLDRLECDEQNSCPDGID